MQSKILLLFICFSMANQLTSQSCLPNGLFLNTQSQVDQFSTLYPGCKVIEGGLSVNGSDIKNLDGLVQITAIGGDFFLTNCDSIHNINGLQNVTTIGGAVRIQGQLSLESINLSKLTKVTGDYCYISDNPLVTSLDKFSVLDSVFGIFQIWSMDSIRDLNGLEKLSFVGRDFAIFKNRNLKNINALNELNHIGDGLRLYENNVLTDVSGLSPTLKIDGPIVINDNPMLSVCNTEAICTYIKNPSSFMVFNNNSTGCSSISEVKASCISSSEPTESISDIKIFPNPASDFFTIVGMQLLESGATLYDMKGQTILKINVNNATNFDISHLPVGLYIVKAGSFYRKLYIQR